MSCCCITLRDFDWVCINCKIVSQSWYFWVALLFLLNWLLPHCVTLNLGLPPHHQMLLPLDASRPPTHHATTRGANHHFSTFRENPCHSATPCRYLNIVVCFAVVLCKCKLFSPSSPLSTDVVIWIDGQSSWCWVSACFLVLSHPHFWEPNDEMAWYTEHLDLSGLRKH